MATKVEDILGVVQARGYGSDTEASQIKMTDACHRRILLARRWRFLLASTEKSTVAGTGTVSLDTLATTKQIEGVRVEEAGGPILEHLDEQDMLDRKATLGTETGSPQFWSVIGGTLHLWPLPDKVYKLAISHQATPTALTAKTTEVQLPDSHAYILAWMVIMELTFRERDWEAHNFARQMYAELFTEMLSQFGMSDRQTAKRVVKSGFFDDYDLTEPWLT